MFCPECGREAGATDKFCRYCGAPFGNVHTTKQEGLQPPSDIHDDTAREGKAFVQSSDTASCEEQTANKQKPQRKKNKLPLVGAIVLLAVVVLFVAGKLSRSSFSPEYSNNSGEMLPIVVTDLTIYGDSFSMDRAVTFGLKNAGDKEYRYARFAVLAWDDEGFPIILDQPMVYSDADYHDYLEYFEINNMRANETQSCECTFAPSIADSAYIAAFLIEYEDFESNKWTNPIADSWEDIEGKKLEDTGLYYFEMYADQEDEPDETVDEPASSGLPSWCAGSYYGSDLYSTINFAENSGEPFAISIYRLVGIENCTVIQQDEYQVSFTGDFDIDTGSVEGMLESYDNGESITLTIVDSSWDMLPAGTVMDFYCDYVDPNYKESTDAIGMCGIYALPEIPANRIFVWNDAEGTTFIALTSHGRTVDAITLPADAIESTDSAAYSFSAYTTVYEEAVSGFYDPAATTLSVAPVSEESELASLGLSGMFFKQA